MRKYITDKKGQPLEGLPFNNFEESIPEKHNWVQLENDLGNEYKN